MNNVFAAKLLQNLRNKKGNKGFTLIELLVVVIIIGVLAAVALPNLLSQVGKARETEIKNAVGTVNRAQQAYHFERQVFTEIPTELGVLLQPKYIDNWGTDPAAASDAITAAAGSVTMLPSNTEALNDGTRAYSGAVYFNAGNYTSFMCQSNNPGATTAAPGTDGACAADAKEVK